MTTTIPTHHQDNTPSRAPHEPPFTPFTPYRVLDLEISGPLPPVSCVDSVSGRMYRRALALVRLHTRPLGVVELHLEHGDLSATHVARRIWDALGAEIKAHAQQDGLPQPDGLDVGGLPASGVPQCMHDREAFLANAPFVSVVVATHDRTPSLDTCLRSLLALEYPNYEIIVVDNAPSTTATADFMRHTYGDEARIRYVREDRPGLACAHNRGLMEVNAPIVAFTDDDVVVDRHWLTELVRGFSAAENVGCVTGMIFPRELETPSQVWIEQYVGFGKGFSRRVFDLAAHRPRHPLFPYSAGMLGSGANMAFRTPVLRAIGTFDPLLGAGSAALGGDDLAAFFQVITAGYALVYEPAAIVHHEHRRDYPGLRKQMYGYGVGLTAYLTKALVDRPGLLLDMATRLPRGVVYALSARSPKNARKPADYPRELTALERKGMLHGPLAYLHSRRQYRRSSEGRAAPAMSDPALQCGLPIKDQVEL